MKKLLLALGLVSLVSSPLVHAEDSSALALNVGTFDVNDDDTAAEFGVEYRFAPIDSFFNIIPVVGLTANSDGGYWAHTGLRYDVDLGSSWVLTPHFAVSYYEEGGSKDLGHELEFRSGLEIAYKLDANSHLGLGIYHLSNAGIGDENPGQESVYLSYSFGL